MPRCRQAGRAEERRGCALRLLGRSDAIRLASAGGRDALRARAFAELAGRKRIQQARRETIGLGQAAHADSRRHHTGWVASVVETEKMTDLVKGHRMHGIV